MTCEDLAVLCDARDKLCGFCEANECEKCIVNRLINDAFNELPDDEDEDGGYEENNCEAGTYDCNTCPNNGDCIRQNE